MGINPFVILPLCHSPIRRGRKRSVVVRVGDDGFLNTVTDQVVFVTPLI
jgi:hypothetical protein